MSVVTFDCPECGKLLKSSRALPAGMEMRCPTCAAVFPMPTHPEENPACGISTAPRPADPPVLAVLDEGDGAQPLGSVKAEVAGKRRSRGAARLLGTVVVVLLLVGGIGAYSVWFSGVNHGGGNEDPLAFVPAGTEVLVGIDGAAVLGDADLRPPIERYLREQLHTGRFTEACQREAGLQPEELYARALICSNLYTLGQVKPPSNAPPARGAPPMVAPGGPTAPRVTTVILRPSRGFDPAKIVRAFQDPAHKTLHGKSYYLVFEGDMHTLFMPSDRTIILSSLSADELDGVFTSDGTTPAVSPETAALVRGVEESTVWLAVPFEGQTRTKLDEAAREAKGIGPLAGLLAKGQGVAVWGTLDGDQVRCGINVACADAATASELAQTAEKGWNAQGLSSLKAATAAMSPGLPKLTKAVSELTGELKFASEGSLATASSTTGRTKLSEGAAEALPKLTGGGLGAIGGIELKWPGAAPPRGGKPNPGRGRGQDKPRPL
jgi:hypothetical protein